MTTSKRKVLSKKVTILKGFYVAFQDKPLFHKEGKNYRYVVNLEHLIPDYEEGTGSEDKNFRITIEEVA